MSKQQPENPGTMSGIDQPDDEQNTRTNLKALELAQVDKYTFRVLNREKGTQYLVDVSDGTCTCEDMEYNREDSEACKHLQKAIFVAPSTMEAADFAARDLEVLSERARNLLWDLREAADSTDGAAGDTDTQAANDPPQETEHGVSVSDPEAREAAERLREAFDKHLTDMQVQHHAGHVWFKTGYDTEEEWPYPGVDETFKAVTAPDIVEYVYESDDGPNHELYDEKPGEYWKNALSPEDVDAYIEEVLE